VLVAHQHRLSLYCTRLLLLLSLLLLWRRMFGKRCNLHILIPNFVGNAFKYKVSNFGPRIEPCAHPTIRGLSFDLWMLQIINHNNPASLSQKTCTKRLVILSHFKSTSRVFENKPVVMGPGQNFLAYVGSGQIFAARVGSVIYGLGLNLENFP